MRRQCRGPREFKISARRNFPGCNVEAAVLCCFTRLKIATKGTKRGHGIALSRTVADSGIPKAVTHMAYSVRQGVRARVR